MNVNQESVNQESVNRESVNQESLNPEILEQYLDGELTPIAAEQVRRTLAADAKAARLLDALQSQRQLRQAALATYAPSAAEVGAITQACFAAFAAGQGAPVGSVGPNVSDRARSTAPVARIGFAALWLRRGSLLAACAVIGAAGFILGRVSSATASSGPASGNRTIGAQKVATVRAPQRPIPYVVRIEQADGQSVRHVFSSYEAARRFATHYAQDRTLASAGAVAEEPLARQGQF